MRTIRTFVSRPLKALGLFHPLRDLRRDWRFRRLSRANIAGWEAAGRPSPPPDLIKYRILRDYARRFQTPILVETGTFLGNAVFTLRHDFREIHSVELSTKLYALNVREIGHLSHIHLHLGDSARVLPEIVCNLASNALFWLDGHFCFGASTGAITDTPVSAELGHLLNLPQGNHVVLIDDARLFTGENGYPSLTHLQSLFRKHRPVASFEVSEDIIRVAPI